MKARVLGTFALAAVFFISGAFAMPASVEAVAGPQVYITWRTLDGVAPAGYAGKILPKIGSQVAASVEVLTASGRVADLHNQTIYWYLDNSFLDGGTGKQTITFGAPGHNEIMSLRADIPGYPGGELIMTAHIRMVNPEVVIVAPYASGIFSGDSVAVKGVPYFFSTSQLNSLVYAWSVNGQTVAAQENPLDLVVNLTNGTVAGYSLGINFSARVSGDPLTSASQNITLAKAGASQ